MNKIGLLFRSRFIQLGLSIIGAFVSITGILLFMGRQLPNSAFAAPILPPDGYPKLSLSTKVVTPVLTGTGGADLEYRIEIVNTGAYTAENVTLVDPIPSHTTFTGKMGTSGSPEPIFANDALTWEGIVGFDDSVWITFSVNILSDYNGIITNTAIISQPQIIKPVSVTVEATVTDDPILKIEKTSTPQYPGANKALQYEIEVTNWGQPTTDLTIDVEDVLPANTEFLASDGSFSASTNSINWTRSVTLGYLESTVFTFSVTVDDVPSGTIITNDDYSVNSVQTDPTSGLPYTVTVIDPILFISKETDPFPPGSNREMEYVITVLNSGSLATDLTVSDEMPDGVTYLSGGTSVNNGVVYWDYPSLDTGEDAQFTYTVYIGDVASVNVLNETYDVCSAEGVCAVGEVLTSGIEGPSFNLAVELDPIAKKPGGGGGPVTPTITIENLGPGSALDAQATLRFSHISVQLSDLIAIPPVGSFSAGPKCGDKCVSYFWVGDISAGEQILLTTEGGQNSQVGDEGTVYSATAILSDTLGDFTTIPISVTAIGKVTHYANLIPTKSAPAVIGAGQLMTYSIQVFNSGLSTDDPPFPILTETVPASLTVVNISDGGVEQIVNNHSTISWTLPSMGPGERINRSFSVLVDGNLISGTEIVNDDYRTNWLDVGVTETLNLSNTGEPITTVVKEVGLIDSFKAVSPTLTRPGPDNVLTYVVHIVNSSLVDLTDVWVHDILPWQSSTYQRDAIASSGQVISDIVSIDWFGNVEASSSEQVTFTVLVDDDFEGAITNTALISHTSLKGEVVVEAVAYVTNDPVLQIYKTAFPNPVKVGNELLYTIYVVNLGQKATSLQVWDTVPTDTTYIIGSANAGGKLEGNQVKWQLPALPPGEKEMLVFKVQVLDGEKIINSDYGVSCAEGVIAFGKPVITEIASFKVYLPLILR